MGYSIVEFAKSLRGEKCKIRNTPNRIFLCGGRTREKGSYQSARDYFYRHLKDKAPRIAERVNLAEDVNAWFHRDEFPDLLELENYLADLADITVLFVESPGSIAELGAFAASDALRPKTLAVLNNFYDSDRTFISEGPVQKIKNENEELVHYYDWDPGRLNSPATIREFGEMARGLTAFLSKRDKSRRKQHGLDKEKHGHALLLVADLIAMAGVATTTDIADCLGGLGFDLRNKQLSRYLSLLESMSFISRVLRSNQAFYVSQSSKSYIRYAYGPSARLRDAKSIKTAIRAALDPIRKNILAKHLRKPARRRPRGV
jgi:hypothetical protein